MKKLDLTNGFHKTYSKISTDFGLTEYVKKVDGKIKTGYPGIHFGYDVTYVDHWEGRKMFVPANFMYCRIEQNRSHGTRVHFYHKDGYRWSVSHMKLEDIDLINMQKVVKKGDLIGPMGNEGFSTGVHAHVELVSVDGSNPQNRPYTPFCEKIEKTLNNMYGAKPFVEFQPAEILEIYRNCKKSKDWTHDRILMDFQREKEIYNIQFINKYMIRVCYGKHKDIIHKTVYNIPALSGIL